jgi:hypothetical protein
MGLSLFVVVSDNDRVDGSGSVPTADIVSAYYDFMMAKAQHYHAVPSDDDRNDRIYTKLTSKELKNTTYSSEPITEYWYSVYEDNVVLDGLFPLDSPVLYGDDIRTFIERLQEAKERVKQQDDDNAYLWERYFELRAIGLCEFALDNGYGIELA